MLITYVRGHSAATVTTPTEEARYVLAPCDPTCPFCGMHPFYLRGGPLEAGKRGKTAQADAITDCCNHVLGTFFVSWEDHHGGVGESHLFAMRPMGAAQDDPMEIAQASGS